MYTDNLNKLAPSQPSAFLQDEGLILGRIHACVSWVCWTRVTSLAAPSRGDPTVVLTAAREASLFKNKIKKKQPPPKNPQINPYLTQHDGYGCAQSGNPLQSEQEGFARFRNDL